MLIRTRAKQSEIAANYVKVVDEEDINHVRNLQMKQDSEPGLNGRSHINGYADSEHGLNGRSHINGYTDSEHGLNERSHINGYTASFRNGVGFNNGNGLSGEQGFAIGGEERLSRSNGYLSELAAAAYVCHVST